MRTAISVGSAYYDGEDWEEMVEFVRAADRLGVDSVWSAEAWGMDAISSLGFLAACTQRIRLGTGIMQISARTPASTAMTAMSLSRISNGRFTLGLGASGPQVVEGLHGAAFAKPQTEPGPDGSEEGLDVPLDAAAGRPGSLRPSRRRRSRSPNPSRRSGER